MKRDHTPKKDYENIDLPPKKKSKAKSHGTEILHEKELHTTKEKENVNSSSHDSTAESVKNYVPQEQIIVYVRNFQLAYIVF